MKQKHWLGRPPRGATDVFRLALNGRWVHDDGVSLGRAFSGHEAQGQQAPIAWGPDCNCHCDDKCPMEKAMSYTCDRFRTANGRTMSRPARARVRPPARSGIDPSSATD